MHVDVSDFLIWLVVGAVGFLARHLRSWSKWKKVRKLAAEELLSPVGTNDPETAVKSALESIQRRRIKQETKSLKAQLNGDLTGPHRKI